MLPPGVHWVTWEEVVERFGGNVRRLDLLKGLRQALENLQKAGCQEFYLDGSFVTDKLEPADFDGCWNKVGVAPEKLDPVLLDFSQERAAQKAKYGGEMFIAQSPATAERLYLDFFQRDRRNQRKGIIGIRLSEELL